MSQPKLFGDREFVRESDLVPDVLPFSRATLWRRVRDGRFPPPVKLSTRVTAWRVEDIREWMSSLEESP